MSSHINLLGQVDANYIRTGNTGSLYAAIYFTEHLIAYADEQWLRYIAELNSMERHGADSLTVDQFEEGIEDLRGSINRMTETYRNMCDKVSHPGMDTTEFE